MSPPRWVQDIHDFQAGAGKLRPGSEYFTKQEDIARYDELLARLLTEAQYREFKSKQFPGGAAETIFEDEPGVQASWVLGQRKVPTYVK